MKVIVVAVGASLVDVIGVARFSLQRCEAGLQTAAKYMCTKPHPSSGSITVSGRKIPLE
jgi:hypothetical protein